MFEKIGGMIVALGVMSAESKNVLIPFAVVLIGMVLVAIGEWRSTNE